MLFPTFQNPMYVKKKHNEGAKNQPEGQLGSNQILIPIQHC